MKILVILIFLVFSGFLGLAPVLNPYLVEHDFLIVPKNLLLKKSPLIRSISDMKADYLKGIVMILRQKQLIRVGIGDTVFPDDLIYVRKNAWLVLKFGFGSKIKVNSDTIIRVNDLKKKIEQFDPTKINTFTLEAGSVYVDYQNNSQEISMKIKTRSASMGVRGTEFIAAVDNERQAFKVAVNHGLVEVGNTNGGDVVLVGDNSGTTVNFKGKAENPKNHNWVKNIHWDVEEISVNNPDNYETAYKEKFEEVKKSKKASLESIKTFKPSGDEITNENMNEKLEQAQNSSNSTSSSSDETVKKLEAQMDLASKDEPEFKQYDKSSFEDMDQADLDEVNLNFSRYNKVLPKINQNVLAKFAEKGLVPKKMQVAIETIQQVDLYNAQRMKALEEIDDSEKVETEE
jgi:uncharacterized protein YnzC (UPF0291/DUF896 family)